MTRGVYLPSIMASARFEGKSMVDRVKRRIQRKKTGVPPTAQQDVDVRETVVDLEPHPDAPDQTKTGQFQGH